ncbi:MAG: N-6 DNA methylase [Parcubacteria bacterium 33_209]|nr:MAG: N-6 DNA methylase [Parcubacteria bacterium 33_209]
MVETQTKNQNIFWLWNTDVDFVRRGDVDFWSPEYVKNDKLMSQYVPLADVIEDITNGVELRKYSDKGELYLRVSNIKEFFTDLSDIKLVPLTREAIKVREKVRLSEQDILMSRSGSLGIITIITPDIKKHHH